VPREITHVLLAREVASRLAGTAWEAPLAACPAALALGSVFHDLLYFPAGREHAAEAARAVALLHGRGGSDTLLPVKAVLRAAQALTANAPVPAPGPTPGPTTHPAPNSAPYLAFAAGLASHIFTDAVFHPFVNFHAGDPRQAEPLARSRAQIRHRRLEALMDRHFSAFLDWDQTGEEWNWTTRAASWNPARSVRVRPLPFGRILGGLEAPLPELATAAYAGLPGGNAAEALARRTVLAARSFARLHTLFAAPLAALAFGLAGPLLPRPVREKAALFHAPALARLLPRLSGELPCPGPAGCGEARTSLAGLFDQAAARTAELLLAALPVLAGSADPAVLPEGPNLEDGRPPGAGAPGPGLAAPRAALFPEWP